MAAKGATKVKKGAKPRAKGVVVKKSAKVSPAARRAKAPVASADARVKVAVSEDTLERLPGRVVAFLMAVGTVPEIRAALMSRGYTDAVHQQGWALLERVAGRSSLAPPPVAPETDTAPSVLRTVDEARKALEEWAVVNFGVADTVLKVHHPAQHAYVFDELKAERGARAVLAVQRFLTRVESLGKARKGAHADDAKALALLGERGIDAASLGDVRELLVVVQRGATPDAAASAAPVAGDSSQPAKLALYAWHREWSGIAQSVIRRRDHRIRLGIASRRKPTKKAPTPSRPPEG
jgi:hypothetical protein